MASAPTGLIDGHVLVVRPATAADADALFRIYASSRQDDMRLLTGWADHQKQAFLREQFRRQQQYYDTHFPGANYDVVECGGEVIGRWYVARLEREIRVIDITVVPGYQQRGVGRLLMEGLLREAAGAGTCVRLHVDDGNPARRFYDRLGFVAVGKGSTNTLMEWSPAGAGPAAGPRGEIRR